MLTSSRAVPEVAMRVDDDQALVGVRVRALRNNYPKRRKERATTAKA